LKLVMDLIEDRDAESARSTFLLEIRHQLGGKASTPHTSEV
jgi:hypothetical protein